MGNGASSTRNIYLDFNGRQETILFSAHSSSQDIHDLICQIVQVRRASQISLKSRTGGHVPIVPSMPQNSAESPYSVSVTKAADSESEVQALSALLGKVGDQFSQALKMEDFRMELDKRLNMIEKRLESQFAIQDAHMDAHRLHSMLSLSFSLSSLPLLSLLTLTSSHLSLIFPSSLLSSLSLSLSLSLSRFTPLSLLASPSLPLSSLSDFSLFFFLSPLSPICSLSLSLFLSISLSLSLFFLPSSHSTHLLSSRLSHLHSFSSPPATSPATVCLSDESLKLVEIEKCKKDIREVRDQVWQQGKKLTQSPSNPLVSMPSQENENVVVTADNGIKFVSLKRMPGFQKYTLSQETVGYLKKPTFDIWHWEPNEMLSLMEHMYHELGLMQEFSINPVTLKRWLLCIQANYRNNPFHNFRHCFCVCQMMYGIIHLCGLDSKLPKEDLGVLITAAICHDLDHPGYNNTYQINARTELAIRYNDISPLENHHCAVAFQILNNPETNIFANVDKDAFQRIRKGMTMLILATDMARHAEILENFKKRIEEGFDFAKKDHTDTLKMVLIKCCDISNEVRPMEVSEPWVDCLLEEYFNQSDREKIEGLPVAPFMDREKVTKPTAQIGFIRFVLIPMFEAVAKVFPPISESLVSQLRNSLQKYEALKEEDEKRRKKAQAESS